MSRLKISLKFLLKLLLKLILKLLVQLLLKPLLKLQLITRKMYSIHFSRYIWFITWKMYWIAKPLFLPLQIFGNVVFYSFFCETLIFKAFFTRGLAIGGRLTTNLLHALCVFLCTPSLIAKWEPLEETSVRELKEKSLRRKSIEDLCEKFSTLIVFGIKNQKTAARTLQLRVVFAIGGRLATLARSRFVCVCVSVYSPLWT